MPSSGSKPIAAGPWKFVSQELNATVSYERFDDYFDEARKPNWRKLVYAIVPDESSRVAGVKTGELDIAYGLTGASADGLDSDPNVRIEQIPETGLGYCMMYDNVFPAVDSPLKDQRVRRALLLAIDRDSIAETLYRGYAKAATSNAPVVMPGFDPNRTAEPYDLQERLGVTYVFVGHDLRLVRHLCHEVAVLYRGRIVEQGAAANVLDAPAHPYTDALVTASALRTLVATDDADTKAVPEDGSAGCAYRYRCPRRSGRCDTETPAPLVVGDRQVRCHHPLDSGEPVALDAGT